MFGTQPQQGGYGSADEHSDSYRREPTATRGLFGVFNPDTFASRSRHWEYMRFAACMPIHTG